MSYSSRFFLYAPFAALLALAAIVMGLWWKEAGALGSRLDALNGHAIAPGVRMSFAKKVIAGFPFRVDVLFDGLAIKADGVHGPIRWQTEHFAWHRLAYDSGTHVFESGGKQTLSWTRTDGTQAQATLRSGALRASAVLDRGGLARFDLDAISLLSNNFSAGRAQFHLRRDPVQDAIDIVIDGQNLHFSGDAKAGLPQGFSRMRIEGRLLPGAPLGPLLAAKAPWREVVDRWHAAHADFRVDQAAFLRPHCQTTGSGDVGFDALRRPAGAIAFALQDCDRLAEESLAVRSGQHRALLALLADLSAQESHDNNDTFPVMLVFRDGLAWLGPGRKSAASSGFAPLALLAPEY
jgi:hypothetical protein